MCQCYFDIRERYFAIIERNVGMKITICPRPEKILNLLLEAEASAKI
jgi:hypothetical protein